MWFSNFCANSLKFKKALPLTLVTSCVLLLSQCLQPRSYDRPIGNEDQKDIEKEKVHCTDTQQAPEKRAIRLLTNREYRTSVRDLFQLSPDLQIGSNFMAETKVAGFSTNHEQATADTRRLEDWLAAAKEVVTNANLDQSLQCDYRQNPECWLTGFATRLMRRPLTADEINRYSNLIKEIGVPAVLESMLVSPTFLVQQGHQFL